jgi:hypothetical protein
MKSPDWLTRIYFKVENVVFVLCKNVPEFRRVGTKNNPGFVWLMQSYDLVKGKWRTEKQAGYLGKHLEAEITLKFSE